MYSFDTMMKSQEAQYALYLNKHIRLVNAALYKYANFIKIPYDFKTMKHKCMLHDSSKYIDIEFTPNRKKMFPVDSSEHVDTLQDELRTANTYHYMHNTHHPEYWIMKYGDTKNMPNEDIVEMVLDWIAHSCDTKIKAYDYFRDNDSIRKLLHPDTYSKVSEVLYGIEQLDLQDLNYLFN